MSPMNPPSTRIRKHRATQRPLPDLYPPPLVSRRRSSQIESRQRSVSIPYIVGSYYESQSPLEQRQRDSQTLQPVGAISYKPVPASGLLEASVPVPPRAQVQEYLGPPQTNSHQSRIETGAERPLKPARLRKENLKTLEEMGGQGRKSEKEPKSNSLQSGKSSHFEAKTKTSATTEYSSKTVSTADSSFPRLAFRNGVFDPLNSAPPENLGYLHDRLNRARDTDSPTESEYQDFVYRTQEAPNEQTMLLETSKLLKEYGRGYRRAYNQALDDFPKNVGFNTGLSASQPDMIEGLDLREFKPFPVRQELGGAAVPTSENNATTLPHLADEWKAGGKDMIQARTQLAYNGACMVYGRNKALLFLESPDPTSHAYIQTFTTDGTTINTFAHHLSGSQDQIKYYQYPTSSSFLVSSYKDFKQGRRRLRNLEDNAKESSEKLRDELNEKWLANHRSPVSPRAPTDTADSTDGNSYEYKDGDNVYAPPYTSFPANNKYDSFTPISTASIYISTASNGYASPDGLISPPITLPQSSEDTSSPLELSKDIDQPNGRGLAGPQNQLLLMMRKKLVENTRVEALCLPFTAREIC